MAEHGPVTPNSDTAAALDGRRANDPPPPASSEDDALCGVSPAVEMLRRQIERLAASDTTVLLIGESGSGKELVARTLHDVSARSERPFIAVNCGAIASGLVEAELFGHEKGSFTGATQQRLGCFEHARGGTLFLDEITEMPPAMQVHLLRVLETGTFHRVGGTEAIRADVRIMAAVNRDPAQAQREGKLREDLLYRLAVFPLRVPPLRERLEDVEPLARRFVREMNEREHTEKTLSRRALDVLRARPWPGNVRELRNTLYRAYILADHTIEIPIEAPVRDLRRATSRSDAVSMSVGTTLSDAQREIILATLDHFRGDKRRAAATLGISLKTLYNRLALYRSGPAVA